MFSTSCDDEKQPPVAEVEIEEFAELEEELEPCPAGGGLLRAAPVLLELSGMATQAMKAQLNLNNGGSGALCFDEAFFSIDDAEAAVQLEWPQREEGIAPGATVSVELSLTVQRAGEGEVKLLLSSVNGGDTELRLRYVATPCIGEQCPSFDAQRYCARTSDGGAGRAKVSFHVENTQRLTVLAATPGVKQRLQSLTPPTGAVDDLGMPRWARARITSDGFDILMPALDPSVNALFAPGAYEVEGSTDSGEFCVYVFEQNAPGRRLAMNFYAVGIGMSGAALALNLNWHNTLDVLEAKLLEHGIELDRENLGYFTVPSSEAAKYSTLRSEEDLDALLGFAQFPETQGESELLRLNVFLIQNFDLGGAVVGLAPLWGIPAGHGSSKGGIAVAAGDFLGVGETVLDDSRPECFDLPTPPDCFLYVEGNRELALVILHEAGHFFGLSHTSELDASAFDEFADTPECTEAADPNAPCADAANIMFPQLRPEQEPSFSDSQRSRILVNTLVQP
jgi:hypothetical protein